MADTSRLAYKAYEIEELVDIYFYRRAGYVVAVAARAVGLSPNAVSVLAGVVGAIGGALVAWPRLAWLGVLGLVLHGIIDSADGQLARMTGRTSELGRILDGVAGYVTHVALYLALVAVVLQRGGSQWVWAVAILSGACTAIHAQLYDYHRTAYAAYAIKGRLPTELRPSASSGVFQRLAAWYAASQRALLGRHRSVEEAIAARASGVAVAPDDRDRYRTCFYRPVLGWNALGDNVRRYTIAACVLLGRPEWFMAVTLGPLNLWLAVMWLVQQGADRRFLAAPDRSWVRS
ncbi:MAG: CDP-alcohol phosphatidyltransferase family protein [Vicinamibacterales bacterium]